MTKARFGRTRLGDVVYLGHKIHVYVYLYIYAYYIRSGFQVICFGLFVDKVRMWSAMEPFLARCCNPQTRAIPQIFVDLTSNRPDLQQDVLQRLKADQLQMRALVPEIAGGKQVSPKVAYV